MNPKNFFRELKRRNVYKVAVAYGVVGWLVGQIATPGFPVLEIPNLLLRLVSVLVAIGFPIAAREHSRGGVWIVVVLIAAAPSLGLFLLGRYSAGHAAPENRQAASVVPRR